MQSGNSSPLASFVVLVPSLVNSRTWKCVIGYLEFYVFSVGH
jgi:hypothetical protein